MNARDAILQELTPVVAVPRFEALAADPSPVGHRFLVAYDGLWIEAQSPWLHARALIAPSAIRLPFGDLAPALELRCGNLPKILLDEFVAHARQASPNETAAIITWHGQTGEFNLLPVARESGATHVHYERPRLSAGECLVADLHSHGTFHAGFSMQDDLDDAGEIKVAVVVGCCHLPTPDFAARLCLLGHYVPLLQVDGGA